MKTEKEVFIEKFHAVIEDLLDHYEEYTEEEKLQIKEIFQKVTELNTILDKYDIERKLEWPDFLTALDRYFL